MRLGLPPECQKWSANNPQIAVRQILENTVKCLVLHWYWNWKVILEPHLESDQRQNSKAFRGSTLANADQVWSTSMTHLWLVLRTDRHTDTHTTPHTHTHWWSQYLYTKQSNYTNTYYHNWSTFAKLIVKIGMSRFYGPRSMCVTMILYDVMTSWNIRIGLRSELNWYKVLIKTLLLTL